MEKHKRRKNPRAMMGFPWPESYIAAFQKLAEMVTTGKARGNSSALARTVLEQFMFALLDFEDIQRLGLLDPWDVEEGHIPQPSILRYAIKKYDDRTAKGEGASQKPRHASSHVTLPS
jgi:hypothetical protein